MSGLGGRVGSGSGAEIVLEKQVCVWGGGNMVARRANLTDVGRPLLSCHSQSWCILSLVPLLAKRPSTLVISLAMCTPEPLTPHYQTCPTSPQTPHPLHACMHGLAVTVGLGPMPRTCTGRRAWAHPDPATSPEVACTLAAMEDAGVDLLVDVHGDEELPVGRCRLGSCCLGAATARA